MKAFCIPLDQVKILKQAVKDGDFNMASLYDMTSKQRVEHFTEWVDEATAKGINAGFESALVDTQVDALEKWAENLFKTAKKVDKKSKPDVLKKIEELKGLGVLNVDGDTADSFLSDLVEESLGVNIKAEEAAKIGEMTDKLDTLAVWGEDKIDQLKKDNPDLTDQEINQMIISHNEGVVDEYGLQSIEYWKARDELEKYLLELTPANRIRIATSTIGRGSMLFSIKSPITNIVGNSVMGIQETLTRRIASGKMSGDNNSMVLGYTKKAVKIYNKSGYDVTRIMSLDARQKVLGEEITHSEGKGIVRKVGRVYEDIVFKRLMGAPDVAFAASALADSANLLSTKLARSEGLKGDARKARSKELLKDALSIEPQTDLGTKIREQSIADATYATFTNDTWYSEFSLNIRKVLNSSTGDIRAGDMLMPFVKTPANVVGVAIESTGLGVVAGAVQLIQARNDVLSGDAELAQQATRRMIRSGLGLTLAFILFQAFKPDDFIGAFPRDEKERILMYEQNASPNSIRIGDRWVSLDYFGNIGSAFTGMMYAKKYGDTLPEMAVGYAEGTKTILAQLPGIEEFSGLAQSITGEKNYKDLTPEDYVNGISSYSIDFVRARTIPAFINDIAKATDKYERDTRQALKDGDRFAKVKASIPFLRESLPIRRKLFQSKEESDPSQNVLLFGSRIKIAERDEVIDEYKNLSLSNNMPTLSDIEDRKAVKQLKEQIGNKEFEKAKEYFGSQWYQLSVDTIKSDEYKKLETDEDKKDLLNTQRDTAITNMLIEYGYIDPETGYATRPKRPSRPTKRQIENRLRTD